jgi:hypothetical protein
MSPGSLPISGMPLFLNTSSKAPSTATIIPKTINSFAMCCIGSVMKNKERHKGAKAQRDKDKRIV